MRELALLGLIAACGARAAPPTTEQPATEAACPHSYAQAKGPCEGATTVTTCGYEEGTCTCEAAGASDGPPQAEWHCTAPPPTVRADGCPGAPPHGACARDGQQCGYGDACTVQYACVDGSWRRLREDCPP